MLGLHEVLKTEVSRSGESQALRIRTLRNHEYHRFRTCGYFKAATRNCLEASYISEYTIFLSIVPSTLNEYLITHSF